MVMRIGDFIFEVLTLFWAHPLGFVAFFGTILYFIYKWLRTLPSGGTKQTIQEASA